MNAELVVKNCSVYFRSGGGGSGTMTTQAASVFEAVRNAWAFFHGSDWTGPRPTGETIFSVTATGRFDPWFVRASDAIGPLQQSLFSGESAHSIQQPGEAFDPRPRK